MVNVALTAFFIFLPLAGGSENQLAAFHPEWVVQSRQLIGEAEEKRSRALDKLRARFPTADDILKELNGAYRPYALDVIVALNWPGTIEALLPLVENDRDGAIPLAVNALVNGDNHQLIGEAYNRLLDQSLNRLSTPTTVAVIDFFTHLRRPCADAICVALLKHPRLEVQQAAALHLAVAPKPDKVEILKKYLPGMFAQVRAQVLLTLYADNKKYAEEICLGDPDPIVQSACGGLSFKRPEKQKAVATKTAPKKKKSKK